MENLTPNPPPTHSTRTRGDVVTITLRRSTLLIILLPVIFLAGLVSGYAVHDLITRNGPASQTAAAVPAAAAGPASPTEDPAAAAAAQAQQVKRYDIPVDDDPFLGPADAEITLIEFSDFECTYCRKWQREAWPQVKAAFPDKVRLVYRDFPLSSIHSNAISAAEAADCAQEQGKYWEFHDKLFSDEQALGQAGYIQYAADLKLDSAKFKDCLSSRRFQAEVENDFQFAADLGVQSTPTFFINGIPVVGAQPYSVFKQVIEKELAGEFPK